MQSHEHLERFPQEQSPLVQALRAEGRLLALRLVEQLGQDHRSFGGSPEDGPDGSVQRLREVLDGVLDQPWPRSGEPQEPRRELRAALEREVAQLYASSRWAGRPLPVVLLGERFDLPRRAIELLGLALLPALEPRLQAVMAHLQGDRQPAAPTIGLAMDLLARTEEERIEVYSLLARDSPLVRWGLLELDRSLAEQQGILLATRRRFTLRPRVLDFLLGAPGLDPALGCWVRRVVPTRGAEELVLAPEIVQEALACFAPSSGPSHDQPLLLHLAGPDGVGKTMLAEVCCLQQGRDLLVARLAELPAMDAESWTATLRLLLAEARLLDAVVYFEGLDHLYHEDSPPPGRRAAFEQLVHEHGQPVFGSSRTDLPFLTDRRLVSEVLLPIPLPDQPQRARLWRTYCAELTEPQAAELARRYTFSGDQTQQSALRALDPRRRGPLSERVAAACKEEVRLQLRHFAVQVESALRWEDLVLPDSLREELGEVETFVREREGIYAEWLGRRYSRGTGVNILLSGPSGTGKTCAVEIMANQLGQVLFRVDSSRIVDKYIGETDKAITRLFETVRGANGILLFDEADALFGKRVKVETSTDRYANMATNTLLQEIEACRSVIFLTTNLDESIDAAFARRVHYHLRFPFPDETMRQRIWEVHLEQCKVQAGKISFQELGERYEMAGGHIRNAVLRAAALAAGAKRRIGMKELHLAASREYRGMGKLVRDAQELRPEPDRSRRRLRD